MLKLVLVADAKLSTMLNLVLAADAKVSIRQVHRHHFSKNINSTATIPATTMSDDVSTQDLVTAVLIAREIGNAGRHQPRSYAETGQMIAQHMVNVDQIMDEFPFDDVDFGDIDDIRRILQDEGADSVHAVLRRYVGKRLVDRLAPHTPPPTLVRECPPAPDRRRTGGKTPLLSPRRACRPRRRRLNMDCGKRRRRDDDSDSSSSCSSHASDSDSVSSLTCDNGYCADHHTRFCR